MTGGIARGCERHMGAGRRRERDSLALEQSRPDEVTLRASGWIAWSRATTTRDVCERCTTGASAHPQREHGARGSTSHTRSYAPLRRTNPYDLYP